MGFNSILVSEHYMGDLPNWFKDKYSDRLLYPDGTLIVSKTEWEYYTNDIFEDYRKALIEIGFFDDFDYSVGIAVMGEDQVMSKVLVSKDDITYNWMNEFFGSDQIWGGGGL